MVIVNEDDKYLRILKKRINQIKLFYDDLIRNFQAE